MTYEECTEILEQFRIAHPEILMNSNVHGIQVTVEDDKPFLELVVRQSIDNDKLAADEVMPGRFDYSHLGNQLSIDARVTVKPVPRIQQCNVRAGDRAYHSLSGAYGTAGWNVYFQTQNIWVCLSNWHVLVDPNNPSPANSDIFLNGAHRAQLHASMINYTWDYAIARYNSASDACAAFRACQDGSSRPYPHLLSKDISFGAEYYKVGARAPICRTGTLRSVGDRQVNYNGTAKTFRGQLIFSKMTDGGDSGCIIVRVSDNTVTGLNFAGNDSETIANPFYKIGWRYLGGMRLEGQDEIPMYDGPEIIGGHRSAFAAFDKYRSESLPSEFQRATRAEALYFLGVARKQVMRNGHPCNEWIRDFVPIRDVPLQRIKFSDLGSLTYFSGSAGAVKDKYEGYLVFG